MKDTFLCPGLVVKIRGWDNYHIVIQYCWNYCCDVLNPRTGNVFQISTSYLREVGVLVGSNFKRKGND